MVCKQLSKKLKTHCGAGQVNETSILHKVVCIHAVSFVLQHTYTKEDCSFLEHIMPDGYNIYISSKHGALVNLGGAKSKLNSNDGNAASQFLPMVNKLSQEPTNHLSGEQRFSADPEQDHQLGLEIDSIDPFGKISQIVIQSPSFNKR